MKFVKSDTVWVCLKALSRTGHKSLTTNILLHNYTMNPQHAMKTYYSRNWSPMTHQTHDILLKNHCLRLVIGGLTWALGQNRPVRDTICPVRDSDTQLLVNIFKFLFLHMFPQCTAILETHSGNEILLGWSKITKTTVFHILLQTTRPLGRVTDVHPGEDGLVRSVTLKTEKSVFKRPVHKTVLLVAAEAEDDA